MRTLLPLLLAALLLSHSASAAQESAPDPADIVRTTADRVLEVVEEERGRYDEDPAPMRSRLDEILAPRLAFDQIAEKVMAEFQPRFDPEQNERFRSAFRRSLVELYSDALVALKAQEVNVEDARMQGDRRATVRMNVRTSDGERFVIHYALGLEGNDWVVRNLLVDGINLGVTFRNQFASLMEEVDGDPAALIRRWSEVQRSDFDVPE